MRSRAALPPSCFEGTSEKMNLPCVTLAEASRQFRVPNDVRAQVVKRVHNNSKRLRPLSCAGHTKGSALKGISSTQGVARRHDWLGADASGLGSRSAMPVSEAES